MTVNRFQRALGFPLIGVAALSLTACSSTSSATAASGTPPTSSSAVSGAAASAVHNDADVTFATGMMPHHEQAVAMAKLAGTRASSTAVKDLAAKIQGAQQPEITLMTGWLTAWGKPVPTPMGGMDMGGGTTGMMSAADMTKLTNTTGSAFDKMFLTMMIAHHQGAVSMAATETTSGKNAGALTLAKNITTSQTAEIAAMRSLLTK